MARGSIVKRASGSYAIRYYGPDGKRRYETIGPNQKDAQRALTARLRSMDDGTWREPSQEILDTYALRWLDEKDPAHGGWLAPTTIAAYRSVVNGHVLPRLGHCTLASVRTGDINALIREMRREGKAPGGVRNVIVPLRAMLEDAVQEGLLASNPASRCKLPPAEDFAGKELPIEHTNTIRQALLALAPPDPFRSDEPDLYHVWMFDLALGTGMRQGELRALAWRHVNRAQRTILVERAYSRETLRKPKTDRSIRTIPIFPSADTALAGLAARAFDRQRYASHGLVLATDPNGGPFWPSNINRRVWHPALEKAKLTEHGYVMHDLRHTIVSRLIAQGADIKLVQAIAGHSSPQITLARYSHLLDSRIREAATLYDPTVA